MESLFTEVESARFGEKFGGFTGIRSCPLIVSCRTVSALTVRGVVDFFLVEGFDGAAGFAAESGLEAGFFAESACAVGAESVLGAPA